MPSDSIRIDIWILPSDTIWWWLLLICFDHPNRETAMLSRGTPQLAKSAIFYGTEIYSVNVGGGGTPFQTDCANTFLTASIIHAQLPLRNCEKKRYTTYCNTYHLRFNRALTRLGFSSMIIKGGIRPCVWNNNAVLISDIAQPLSISMMIDQFVIPDIRFGGE